MSVHINLFCPPDWQKWGEKFELESQDFFIKNVLIHTKEEEVRVDILFIKLPQTVVNLCIY